jgi:hypothetical protein
MDHLQYTKALFAADQNAAKFLPLTLKSMIRAEDDPQIDDQGCR